MLTTLAALLRATVQADGITYDLLEDTFTSLELPNASRGAIHAMMHRGKGLTSQHVAVIVDLITEGGASRHRLWHAVGEGAARLSDGGVYLRPREVLLDLSGEVGEALASAGQTVHALAGTLKSDAVTGRDRKALRIVVKTLIQELQDVLVLLDREEG